MSVVATAPAASRVPVRRQGAYDRVFYGGMAAVMALTVLAGFASTYYFRFLDGGPRVTLSGGPFTTLVHLHGALFTTWVLLFVVQTALVASRRTAVHRRLGMAGVVLAATMLVVGTSTALAAARRGASPTGVDPLAFLAIPLFDMLLFGTFITCAVLWRRNREAHKRLMLLAYVSIITAAIARLPWLAGLGPLVFFSLSLLFVVAGVAYDLSSRRRVHPVYLAGGAAILVSIPLRLALSGTTAWREFAAFLIR